MAENLELFYVEPVPTRKKLPTPVVATEESGWTFLTNHSHVLIYLQTHPGSPLRQAALSIGITERAVQRIVSELEAAGVIQRERVGRSNRYSIFRDIPLRHSLEKHCTVGDILDLIAPPADA